MAEPGVFLPGGIPETPPGRCGWLVPDPAEPTGHAVHVSSGVLYVGVAHVLLGETHVAPLNRQSVTASVSESVRRSGGNSAA